MSVGAAVVVDYAAAADDDGDGDDDDDRGPSVANCTEKGSSWAPLSPPSPTRRALARRATGRATPHHPLLAGAAVAVDIVASTGGHALVVWVLEASYDPAVLEFASAATADAYTAAVVVNDPAAGVLSLSTSGTSSGTTAAAVTGTAVGVVSLAFRVAAGAAAGSHGGALALLVKQMVNEYSIAFAEDVPAQINDARGGAQVDYQVAVAALSDVGIWAYAGVNELANTAPLRRGVTTSIEAVAVTNGGGSSSSSSSSSSSADGLVVVSALADFVTVGGDDEGVLSVDSAGDISLLASASGAATMPQCACRSRGRHRRRRRRRRRGRGGCASDRAGDHGGLSRMVP